MGLPFLYGWTSVDTRRRTLAGGLDRRQAQGAVTGAPDLAHAASGAAEKRRGGQGHESHQQRVFDQILAVFVMPKAADRSDCKFTLSLEQIFHTKPSLRAPFS